MKTDKTNMFEFNHIDKSLSKTEVECLKDFYKHYHKKYWCFKKSYKRYKKVDETLAITGGGLIVVGTIAGGLTLNPIILGVINGTGVIVASMKQYAKMKNYKKKIEMSQIAFTTYEKVLVELRSALQGDDFNKQEFIDRMKLIDEMIMDQTPIADRFAKRYNKKCV